MPSEFDSKRPAVRFHHVCFETSIKDHPLASRLPKPTASPSIQAGGDVFRGLKARDDIPVTLQDYICSDDPPLELHVFTFSDATIVTLNFPHFCTDAVGLSTLIENWCKILAGRPEEVDIFPESDPLDSVGQDQVEEHILSKYKLAELSMLVFILNFVYDIVFGPKMETRAIFLPEKSVAALKETTIASVPSNLSGQGCGAAEKPFVSEGDVIAAWGIRNISLGLGSRCKRTLAVMNVFELRSRLRHAFESSSTTAYVQNAFSVITTIFTVQEAQTSSLGEIALRLRSSIKEQTSVPQVEALVRMQKASIQNSDRPAVFAQGDSILLPFSNWGKARFFDVVDFSPAIVKAGSDKKRNDPGKPVLFLSCDSSPKPNPTYRNVINIIGKDPSGNYWITGMLSRAAWKEIEKDFKRM